MLPSANFKSARRLPIFLSAWQAHPARTSDCISRQREKNSMKTRSIGVSVLSFWRAAEMRHRLISLAIVLAAIVPATGAPIFGLPESAIPFGLLGESVSNTGTSYVVGDVGATSTNTGFPPGMASGFVCPPVTGGPACTGAEDTAVTTAYNAIFNSVGDAFSTAESLTPTPGGYVCSFDESNFPGKYGIVVYGRRYDDHRHQFDLQCRRRPPTQFSLSKLTGPSA
jgi:hypothetical protein